MNISSTKIDRRNLLYHLGLLTRRWRQALDSEFQAAGLTDATWRPLLYLHHPNHFSDMAIAQFGQFILSLESTVNDVRSRVKR